MSGFKRSGIRQIVEISAILWTGLLIGSVISALFNEAHAAPITPRVGLSGVQYALEEQATSRLDLSVQWKSEDALHDLRFLGFYETGSNGEYSIDLDPVVIRPSFGENGGRFWVGRDHPAIALLPENSISRTSALGANWVQNQHDALNPRISGWVGAGIHYPIQNTGLTLSVAYSPVFLPSMTPSLTLSENSPASGSRFTRLPPTQFQLAPGVFQPLRYRLETGDLREIVFQNQGFLGVGFSNDVVRASLMTWSAPSASPSVNAQGFIRIEQETETSALAIARPTFPRQNFVGAAIALPNTLLQPEAQAMLETHTSQITLSAQVTPVDLSVARVTTGFLCRIPHVPHTAAASGVSSPDYAALLGWIAAETQVYGPVTGEFRLEQHVGKGNRGFWARPALNYSPRENLSFYAAANVLSGEDRTYFGAWRSLDSVSIGARAIW